MSGDLHQSRAPREQDDEPPEPLRIRRFRMLVSALMVVMMLGILGIAGALIWRLSQNESSGVALPLGAEIAVAPGERVISASRAGGRLILLLEERETGKRRIEERHSGSGRLLASFTLVPEPAMRED